MGQPVKLGVQFWCLKRPQQLHAHGEPAALEQIRVGDHPDRHPRLYDGNSTVALAQHQLDYLSDGGLK